MEASNAAVVGSPIRHSLSPILHRAAYRTLGLDWTYEAQEVRQGELKTFIGGLDDSWAGLSVTMPLKEEALALADSASELAMKTQAANTLVFNSDGAVAHNTDVAGLVWSIESVYGQSPSGAPLTILGSGATARSAVAAARDIGFGSINVVGRTSSKVESLVDLARSSFGLHATAIAIDDLRSVSHALEAPVVVNTIPGDGSNSILELCPRSPGAFIDVVYDPLATDLGVEWIERGGEHASGVRMLVGQAAEQVQLMTGIEGALQPIRESMLIAVGDFLS